MLYRSYGRDGRYGDVQCSTVVYGKDGRYANVQYSTIYIVREMDVTVMSNAPL
jgi:hypothetical protein